MRRKYSIDGYKTVGATLAVSAAISGGASALEMATDVEVPAIVSTDIDLTWQETKPDREAQASANHTLIGSMPDSYDLTRVFPNGETIRMHTPNIVERAQAAGNILGREFAASAAAGEEVTVEGANRKLTRYSTPVSITSIEKRDDMLVASQLETRAMDEIRKSHNIQEYEELAAALRDNPEQFSAAERMIISTIFDKENSKPYDITLYDNADERELHGTIYTYGHQENDAFVVIDMFDTNNPRGVADIPLNLIIVPVPWLRRRDETEEYISSKSSLRSKRAVSRTALERTIIYDRPTGYMVESPKPSWFKRAKRAITGNGYGGGRHRGTGGGEPTDQTPQPTSIAPILPIPKNPTPETEPRAPRHARTPKTPETAPPAAETPTPAMPDTQGTSVEDNERSRRRFPWKKLGAIAMTATLAAAHILPFAARENSHEPQSNTSSAAPEMSVPIDEITLESCGGDATIHLKTGEFNVNDPDSCVGVQVNRHLDDDRGNYLYGEVDSKLTLINITPEQPTPSRPAPEINESATPARNTLVANGMGGEQLMVNMGYSAQDWYVIKDQLANTFRDKFYVGAPGDVYIQNAGPLPAEVETFIIERLG